MRIITPTSATVFDIDRFARDTTGTLVWCGCVHVPRIAFAGAGGGADAGDGGGVWGRPRRPAAEVADTGRPTARRRGRRGWNGRRGSPNTMKPRRSRGQRQPGGCRKWESGGVSGVNKECLVG